MIVRNRRWTQQLDLLPPTSLQVVFNPIYESHSHHGYDRGKLTESVEFSAKKTSPGWLVLASSSTNAIISSTHFFAAKNSRYSVTYHCQRYEYCRLGGATLVIHASWPSRVANKERIRKHVVGLAQSMIAKP